jgi:PAS domain S-box-containing protein
MRPTSRAKTSSGSGSSTQPNSRHWEWTEAWREAVRACPLALGLVELPSTQFIELSARAAELLGTTSEDGIGLDYLSIVEEHTEVEQTVRLMTAGALESLQARRCLRRRDGSVVEVSVCGRAIRSSSGADLGLFVVVDVLQSEPRPAAARERLADLRDRLVSLEPDAVHSAVGQLDHRWQVAHISTDVEDLLGHRPAELVGSSIIDLTHPRDAADLLLAFAQATGDVRAGVRIRMRHSNRTWQPVTAVVAVLDDDGAAPFAFVLAADGESDASADRKRLTDLEHHLQRIAVEVQAADVLRVLGPRADANRVPALSGLSARQWEVISRLARGERVSMIASELYLSQSTVRNHLSAIFRKVGVHSQRELLAVLRGD